VKTCQEGVIKERRRRA